MATKTSVETLYDKDYLGLDDLLDPEGKPREFTLQIEAVKGLRLKRPGTPDDDPGKLAPIVTLKGARKKLVLNKVNKDAIKGMYGKFVEDWVGKLITIYGDPKVRAFGKTVGGVRVRLTVPRGKAEAVPDKVVDPARKAVRDEAFGRGAQDDADSKTDRGNDPEAY